MHNVLKIFLFTIVTLLLLSGCTSNSRLIQLQNKTIRQSMIIQKQQQQIAQLQAQLQQRKELTKQRKYSNRTHYPKPKKNIKLKKVEDTNYSSDYMYPDDKKAKAAKTVASATPTLSMDKPQCIAMIGEAKFNRYTEMFGSEAAAIKRCAMIQAMKR